MCGIAGAWTRTLPAPEAREAVLAMAQTLAHRGPDDQGDWSEGDVVLCQRRLAIIDLSPQGHQPMISASGRGVIVFNGEIYNHDAIRAELEGLRPRAWRGRSDTEVLCEAIEEWGLDGALDRTIGMFAFVWWDRPRRKMSLVRDRFGVKPLYYAAVGSGLWFGSELKALVPHLNGRIDDEAVRSCLHYGFVRGPRSIWAQARQVPPGSIVEFTDPAADPVLRTWWDPVSVALSARSPRSTQDAVDELEALLSDSVRLRMIADVPLGAFLSGGIDSSLVTALMQRHSRGAVRTFSIGWKDPQWDESAAARRVADYLGTDHTEWIVDESEALALVERLPEIWDEPLADSSRIPTLLVSQMARRHVTVALSGDGGDEFFGGYNRYLVADRLGPAWGSLPAGALGLASGWLRSKAVRSSARAFGRLSGGRGLRLPESKLEKLATVLETRGARDYWRALLEAGGADPAWSGALKEPAPWPDLPGSDVRRMQVADVGSYLVDDILAKVDRASMAVSLESREPLLDHRLYAFAMGVPTAWHLRGGVGKRLLRAVLARYLPPRLFERPKMGFGIPVGAWIRGPLRPWARALVAEVRAHDWLDVPAVSRTLDRHLAGPDDLSERLWPALSFLAWFRTWGPR